MRILCAVAAAADESSCALTKRHGGSGGIHQGHSLPVRTRPAEGQQIATLGVHGGVWRYSEEEGTGGVGGARAIGDCDACKQECTSAHVPALSLMALLCEEVRYEAGV